ncbi:MAG: hypothetical protein CVU84_00755 [Firmicutes bacterium HGW-Firmicutes-1]|nr:MAG: hypothetical protein CVU84_00755 [Firmicutes bacterium HGW-Firmicutes-1]
MEKVSIIMSVYNGSNYLKKSIESILNQTLQDIQIILVNDGSTDDSLSICQEYAKQDKRIIVIDKSNGGLASGRNTGIENAAGEYIGFVDQDDWIETDMYENMYQQVKQAQTDICMCNYKSDVMDKSIPIYLDIDEDLLQDDAIFHSIILNMVSTENLDSNSKNIMACVWRLIVKKEFIEKNNIRFHGDILIMDDLVFCMEAFLKTNRVSIDKGCYYHYVNYVNSFSATYKEDMLGIQKKTFDALVKIFTQENKIDLIENKLGIRYANMFISAITNEVHKDNHKSISEKIRVIDKLCRDEKLQEILKCIDTRGYTLRKKLVIFAVKYVISIYLFAYYSFIVRVSRKQCR